MSSAAHQYLAFLFFPDRVGVSLWQKKSDQIHVLAQSELVQTSSAHERDLSTAIDAALDQLGETGLSVKNALFLVPSHWVETGDLDEKHKRYLKSLTHDLMLEPMGYVVLTDTLLAHEAAKSPQPFNGFLLFDSCREWILEEVSHGLSLGVQTIGKSQDLTADTAELTSRLQTVTHQERALLVPLEESSRTTTQETLEAALPTPVEVLTPQELAKIAVQLGGKEILSQQPAGEEKVEELAETNNENLADNNLVIPEEVALDPESDDDFAPATLLSPSPEEAEKGIEGELVAEEAALPKAAAATVWSISPQSASRIKEVSPAGFVINRSASDSVNDESTLENSDVLEDFEPEEPTKARFKLPSWKPQFSLPRLPFKDFSGNKVAIISLIGVGCLVLLLGGGAIWAQQTYTTVATVWIRPTVLEQSANFVAGAPNASASGALPLPGQIQPESVTLEVEVPATGNKITGDPATGTITIFNKTEQDRTFPSGTKFQAGEIGFVLDKEVTVPAAQSSEDSDRRKITTPGKLDTSLKAAAIGPQGNIDKNVTLTVANFGSSSYEAVTKEAFTGGTQREIQAVSQQDIDGAAKQLRQAASQQLDDTLAQKNQTGQTVFPSKQVAVQSVTSVPEVGAESKFVKVTLTAESPVLTLTAEETLLAGQDLLGTQVPQDQELLPDSIVFNPENVTVLSTGQTFLVQAKVTGEVVPRVQASDLSEKIQGKDISRAGTLLSEQSGVTRQEIEVTPSWIRWIFPRIPSDLTRIRLNIKLDRNG